MSAVTGSLVIACTPEEVLGYSGVPERRAEWHGARTQIRSDLANLKRRLERAGQT